MRGGVRFGWPWQAAACFAALLTAGLGLGADRVSAATVEYCVTCKNPSASYRCRVEGPTVTQSDGLKLYCVVRTTKEGGHASCSAKRKAGCPGLVKVYQYDGPALPGGVPSDARLRKLNEQVERQNRAFDDNRGEQPKSLFELGGRAYDASKRGLTNAGAAIGLGGAASQADAPSATQDVETAPPPPAVQESAPAQKNFARRSYDCVMSLFRECGKEE